MGNCTSRREARRARCRAINLSINNREPINRQEALQQTIVQYYRPRNYALNQQRLQLPTESTVITLRSIHTTNSNELIERLTTFTQILNEVDTSSINNNPTDINQYKTYILNKPTTKACSICLEYMGDTLLEEMITELPCKHIYHKDCLAKWFSINNTCPLCKSIN